MDIIFSVTKNIAAKSLPVRENYLVFGYMEKRPYRLFGMTSGFLNFI